VSGVVALSTSGRHALGLSEDGTVWAWGSNNEGQLGTGTMDPSPAPVRVSGLTDVVAVSAGQDHSLALRGDGTVWAWGGNRHGQLGNGTMGYFFSQPTPNQVGGLTDVVAIAASEALSVAVRRDGTVWAWGSHRTDPVTVIESHLTPVQMEGLTDVVAVSLGRFHGLALRADGTTMGWGVNEQGQLANGESNQHLTPTRVQLPCRFTGLPSREHRASEQAQCHEAP
jgi:alpha-tubulin suppressor-like RCC1 family protein